MFEFILEYPEIEGCNHWKQKIFPTQAQPGEENGFFDMGSTYSNNYWHGLALSSSNEATYIDGSPSDATTSWFFGIGQKSTYNSIYRIPHPDASKTNTTYLSEIRLWIRKPDSLSNKCTESITFLLAFHIKYLIFVLAI